MLPIYDVINYKSNRYLLSKAIMKRARQINFIGDDSLDEYDGKIVSLSMQQVLEGDIKYFNPQDKSRDT